VIICGMAGARQGWCEAEYRETPCVPVEPGSAMAVPSGDCRLSVLIVPGLAQREPPDVMRGEETQLAGLAASINSDQFVACLPGTHSKWPNVADGDVVNFRTFMTGVLFSLLCKQSILRPSIGPEVGQDARAFLDGVHTMLADPEGLIA